MLLTAKQEEGLNIILQRYKNKEKYTTIAGYAGTGKTTLVKFAIEALADYGIDPEKDVCYAAYTGKAAEVLRQKGNPNAITTHKLLYDHFPKPNGGFFRKPKITLAYKIVVIDEISMLPREMAELLLSHRVYVICLGDPFQLPPIDKDSDNHILDHPHIFLDEIMRQAADSEIIQLTMKIRNQEPIDYFDGNDVKIFPYSQLTTGMLQWADQILTGTNRQRININNQMRQLLGRGSEPEDGDKVICLRNYWDEINEDGDALVNGLIGYLQNSFYTYRDVPRFIKCSSAPFQVVQANLIDDMGLTMFDNVEMDKHMIMTGEKCCDWKTSYKLGKLKERYGEIIPKEFAYAYAITCHKSQGSEWDKVLVLEEKFPFDKVEHARWLYTAATRASNKLVLVR